MILNQRLQLRRHLRMALAVTILFSCALPAAAILPLAEQFPPAKLAQVLLPTSDWRPFPVCTQRAAWESLPANVKTHLVSRGEQALTNAFPPLPATLYLEYARVGNRSRFQKHYFGRRELLCTLVLAECVEGKGRFLDAAANALWAICEESSWCLPAHVNRQKAGMGLPDVEEPTVDLFAGETGVSVAWTLYLLGPDLQRVSARIPARARLELEKRILNPVFERDFGWMALNVASAERRPNNWTPWIASSVLTAALLCDTNDARRVAVTHKMMRSLDGFLKFHPADGGCDEGPGYWSRAAGSAFDCLDLLHSASGGQIDRFGEPLIREMGRFICRVHIAGDYYVPIGDCGARLEPERSLLHRYGWRINDADLLAAASHQASMENVLPDNQYFGRQIYAVFNAAEILARSQAKPAVLRDAWLPSEDMQLMIARSRAGSSSGLYVAAWGAHNAQSHNHNDVGNVLVFMDGKPVFIDPGAPTYTAATFSSKRYDIWAFQSQYHNVPTINGVMQSDGRRFAASQVTHRADDASAELTMNLVSAYPPSAQVKSWIRKVTLVRDRSIEIQDQYAFSGLAWKTALHFMCAAAPETAREPGRVHFPPTLGVRVEYDPAQLAPRVEAIRLDDERLIKSWGANLYRLSFDLKQPALEGVVAVRIVPAAYAR
jgi:hypothetical protein